MGLARNLVKVVVLLALVVTALYAIPSASLLLYILKVTLLLIAIAIAGTFPSKWIKRAAKVTAIITVVFAVAFALYLRHDVEPVSPPFNEQLNDTFTDPQKFRSYLMEKIGEVEKPLWDALEVGERGQAILLVLNGSDKASAEQYVCRIVGNDFNARHISEIEVIGDVPSWVGDVAETGRKCLMESRDQSEVSKWASRFVITHVDGMPENLRDAIDRVDRAYSLGVRYPLLMVVRPPLCKVIVGKESLSHIDIYYLPLRHGSEVPEGEGSGGDLFEDLERGIRVVYIYAKVRDLAEKELRSKGMNVDAEHLNSTVILNLIRTGNPILSKNVRELRETVVDALEVKYLVKRISFWGPLRNIDYHVKDAELFFDLNYSVVYHCDNILSPRPDNIGYTGAWHLDKLLPHPNDRCYVVVLNKGAVEMVMSCDQAEEYFGEIASRIKL